MSYYFRLFCIVIFIIVAAVFLKQFDTSEVTLIIGSWHLNMSLMTAVFILLIFILSLYLLFKILSFLFSIKKRISNWRRNRILDKENRLFKKGLLFFLEDKYMESNKIFSSLLADSNTYQDRFLLFILSVKSNFSIGDYDSCLGDLEGSLNCFESDPPSLEAFLVLKIKVLIAKKTPEKALVFLQKLNSLVGENNLNVLELSLNIHVMLEEHLKVINVARLLLDRNGESYSNLDKIIDEAGSNLINEYSAKNESCYPLWKYFKSQERLLPKISLYFSRYLVSCNQYEEASKVLEKSINNSLEQRLIYEYANNCDEQQLSSRIKKVELWLEKNENNCDLLNALGILCLKYKLWGQAELYLLRSLNIEDKQPYPYLLLISLYSHLSRTEDVELHWEKYLSISDYVVPTLEKELSFDSNNIDIKNFSDPKVADFSSNALRNEEDEYFDSAPMPFSIFGNDIENDRS
ncbi:MAG: hypothetical protein I1N47_01140 [Candidatus Kinetoplastibacterium crithidii]|nr:MAG: hypothetical protein I1N47_01140 [Candidatus Kinetoplastibacterium crithidii]